MYENEVELCESVEIIKNDDGSVTYILDNITEKEDDETGSISTVGKITVTLDENGRFVSIKRDAAVTYDIPSAIGSMKIVADAISDITYTYYGEGEITIVAPDDADEYEDVSYPDDPDTPPTLPEGAEELTAALLAANAYIESHPDYKINMVTSITCDNKELAELLGGETTQIVTLTSDAFKVEAPLEDGNTDITIYVDGILYTCFWLDGETYKTKTPMDKTEFSELIDGVLGQIAFDDDMLSGIQSIKSEKHDDGSITYTLDGMNASEDGELLEGISYNVCIAITFDADGRIVGMSVETAMTYDDPETNESLTMVTSIEGTYTYYGKGEITITAPEDADEYEETDISDWL